MSPMNKEDIEQHKQEMDEIQHKLQRLNGYLAESMALVLLL
jgi:hypothetical protein